MLASRKSRENGRITQEVLAQKEPREEEWVVGALREEAMMGPGRAGSNTGGQNGICIQSECAPVSICGLFEYVYVPFSNM